MARRIDQSDPLFETFELFQEMDAVRDSKARKKRVRSLEGQVKSGEIAISNDKMRRYLACDYELARILVYLCIKNGEVNSDRELWIENVRSEWELLRRRELSRDVSRMPLYYAVRAYLSRLRAAPRLKAATNDRFFISEIESFLSKSVIDHNSQLRDRVVELLSVIEDGDSSSSTPAIAAAFISRRGAILSAAITAVAAVIVAIVANWDKISAGGP